MPAHQACPNAIPRHSIGRAACIVRPMRVSKGGAKPPEQRNELSSWLCLFSTGPPFRYGSRPRFQVIDCLWGSSHHFWRYYWLGFFSVTHLGQTKSRQCVKRELAINFLFLNETKVFASLFFSFSLCLSLSRSFSVFFARGSNLLFLRNESHTVLSAHRYCLNKFT